MKRNKKTLFGGGAVSLVVLVAAFLFLSPGGQHRPVTAPPMRVPVTEGTSKFGVGVPFLIPLPEIQPPAAPQAVSPEYGAAPQTPTPPEKVTKGPFEKRRIALVIDDMGVNLSGSARAIKLPSVVTLSFLPYASNIQEQTNRAKKAGHELLLHLPMEAIHGDNPGPGALFVRQSPEEMQEKLDKDLASFEGFDGVNNHMGSRLTADETAMHLVMQTLEKKGLFFLDSRTGAKSVAEKIAREEGLQSGGRDVFLDDPSTAGDIIGQLHVAERIAGRKGFAIVIGHPHAKTLQTIEAWLPDAASRGIEVVPLRELMRR